MLKSGGYCTPTPKNGAGYAWEQLQIDTDLLLTITLTGTAYDLSGGTNIGGLELPWTPKIRVLVSFFWLFQAAIHISKMNCADRPGQPAFEMFGIKRRCQRCMTPRLKESSVRVHQIWVLHWQSIIARCTLISSYFMLKVRKTWRRRTRHIFRTYKN